jgi:hypothetical protein
MTADERSSKSAQSAPKIRCQRPAAMKEGCGFASLLCAACYNPGIAYSPSHSIFPR